MILVFANLSKPLYNRVPRFFSFLSVPLVLICNLVAKHNKLLLSHSFYGSGIQKQLSWMFWAQNLLRVQPRRKLGSSPRKVCLRLEGPFPASAGGCGHHVSLSARMLRQRWPKEKAAVPLRPSLGSDRSSLLLYLVVTQTNPGSVRERKRQGCTRQ